MDRRAIANGNKNALVTFTLLAQTDQRLTILRTDPPFCASRESWTCVQRGASPCFPMIPLSLSRIFSRSAGVKKSERMPSRIKSFNFRFLTRIRGSKVYYSGSARARQKGAAPSTFAFTPPRQLRWRCEGEGGRGSRRHTFANERCPRRRHFGAETPG